MKKGVKINKNQLNIHIYINITDFDQYGCFRFLTQTPNTIIIFSLVQEYL